MAAWVAVVARHHPAGTGRNCKGDVQRDVAPDKVALAVDELGAHERRVRPVEEQSLRKQSSSINKWE